MNDKLENKPSTSATRLQAARGASWLVAGRLVAKILDALILILLARILAPKDFGLVALAMSFVLIFEAILELPIGQALLRLNHISSNHLDTAFTLALLRGLGIITATCIIAYPLGAFTGESRLPPLLIALSFAPAVRGMSNPSLILYIKKLDFRRDFALDVTGKIVSGALAFAVASMSGTYWALAVGTLAGPTAMTITSYLISPRLPRLTLSQWNVFSHFVSWNFFSQIFISMSWQCDKVFLGRYISSAELGRYTVGSDMTNLPYQAIVIPVSRSLSTLIYNEAGSAPSLQNAYAKTSAVLATMIAPIYVGMYFLSPDAIELLLGPSWSEAGALASIMSLAFLPGIPVAAWNAVAVAKSKANWVTILAFTEFSIKVPLTWLIVAYFGAEGAAWVRLIMSSILSILGMLAVKNLIYISVGEQIKIVQRPILAVTAMALIVGPLSSIQISSASTVYLVSKLFATVLAGFITFTVTLFLLWVIAGRPRGIESFVIETVGNRVRMLR